MTAGEEKRTRPAGRRLRLLSIHRSAVIGGVVVIGLLLPSFRPVAASSKVPECAVRSSEGGLYLVETPQWPYVDAPGTDNPIRPNVLGVDPVDPARLFVANGGILMRSEDGGCSWSSVFEVPPVTTGGATLPCHAAGRPQGQLYDLMCSDIDSLVGTPTGPGESALFLQSSCFCDGGWVTQIFESRDGGDTWSAQSQDTTLAGVNLGQGPISIAPSDPKILYAARENVLTGDGNVISNLFSSDDGGRTWTRRSTPAAGGQWMTGMAVDPTDPNILWAGYLLPGKGVSLFRSNDAGDSWTPVQIPVASLHDVAVSSKAIAIAGEGRTYVSTDQAASWRGLPDDRQYEEVAFGKGPWDLFLLDSWDTFARVDVRRQVGTMIKSHPYVTEGRAEEQHDLVRSAGGGVFFLLGCGTHSMDCTHIAYFRGRGS